VVVSVLTLVPSLGYAEFTLDFTPKNGAIWRDYSGRYIAPYVYNQTPIAIEDQCCIHDYEGPEMVVDPINGKTYYHVLMGSLADGFIQETFIETDSSVLYGSTGVSDGVNVWGYGPTSWSRPGSVSGGGIDDLSYPCCGPTQVQGGNQLRIFGPDAGNGTGDPRKVIIRQVVSYGDITMEFLKDNYSTKPRISMTLDTVDVHMEFVADMRTVTYTDDQTSLSIVNRMYLKGADAPPDLAAFDITTDSQQSDITAGQFIYTPGNYLPTDGYGAGAGGTYTYSAGGFDHYAVDWASYIDPALYNPWSYPQQ